MQIIVILNRTEFIPKGAACDERTTLESVHCFENMQDAMRWAEEITEAQEWSSCVVAETTRPPDIFWNRHRHTSKVRELLKGNPAWTQTEAETAWQFIHPYVCVIHESTGRGYYLDRKYNYICSVEHIIRPGDPGNEDYVPHTLKRVLEHEATKEHRAGNFQAPQWALGLPVTDFTSYWLY